MNLMFSRKISEKIQKNLLNMGQEYQKNENN